MKNVASSLPVATFVTMVQLCLFTGDALPVDAPPPAEEPSPINLAGDLTGHPFLPLFEIPVLIHRSASELLEMLPSTFSCVTLGKNYEIEHSNRKAKIHILPLDNPPSGESNGRTSIREARAAQKMMWKYGVFAPIDWFILAEMLNEQNGLDVAFMEMMRSRYSRYRSVFILFTDPIKFGQSQDDFHVVWESKDSFQSSSFTVVSADKLVSLQNGETVLTACVYLSEVIT